MIYTSLMCMIEMGSIIHTGAHMQIQQNNFLPIFLVYLALSKRIKLREENDCFRIKNNNKENCRI